MHQTCSKLSNIVNKDDNNITSNDVIQYINNLPKNISSQSKYFHLSKKKDIYDLGKVFFKLIKIITGNNRQFIEQQPKIKKLYMFIIDNMLTDMERRNDSKKLLQKFILLEKHNWKD
jgi:hypothetical protein